ncbi:MAG: beta-ketoacyl-[acyl-carrier-protein] synthase family protein [Myxococcales bacterium]|nr:beta-ketoacyl-[acyl-carrier-protein] synthase family protein [Myxococcales bacterium]
MRDPADDIVVTGAGVCTSVGDDLDAFLGALRQGRQLAVPFATWSVAVEHQCRCLIIGRYPGDLGDAALGIAKAEGRFMGRTARLALVAARRALAQSKVDTRDLAVVAGSGTGDVDTHLEMRDKLQATHDAKRIAPTVIPRLMASTVSANLVNVLRTTGPSFSATAACAGGAYNLLLAAQLIRSGHAKAALAGGVETSDPHFSAGFDAMRAYNSGDNDDPGRASRPYAADRGGFVFAEGAGMVVLERRVDAAARGATVLGTLVGFGMSSDGEGNMVAPATEGALAALESALRTSGVAASEIDYVNTHGTSTPLGDVSEVRALRRLFAGRRVAYSSTKGYTGHTISAAGAIEAVFTWAMLREGWVAPCIHAEPLDPELADYPPVLRPTEAKLRYALSNSFGFGGTNATLVLAPP